MSLYIIVLLAGGARADDGMFAYLMPWNDASLNLTNISEWNEKPAGRHGFITVRDGHLVAGGKRLRMLGVNMTFAANFPTHEEADAEAARLARFGINIVRFHHMDSRAASEGIMKKDNVTLDPAQLERLDYFIAALKKQGIYADLNLHVGRTYPGFAQWQDAKGNLAPKYWKGVDVFYPPMIAMQQDYARALLTHYNPYTNTRYVDEPAVALIEINNEDGLIYWWMGSALEGMTDPILSDFTGQWNAWLKQRYANDDALKKAWGVDESLEKAIPVLKKNQFKHYPLQAQRDWLQFLWDTESHYWVSMRDFLKTDLKAKSLIIGTQVSYSPAPIQAQMDVVDGHGYWQQPVFPDKPWDPSDWYILNTPMAGDADGGALAGLALRRVAGKPFTVSEYNHPFPSEYASEALPLLAAYAALQDWDAIFAFSYENKKNWNPGFINDYFALNADPDKMSGMLLAAALFRRADVQTVSLAPGAAPSHENVMDALRANMVMPSANTFGAAKNEAVLAPVSFDSAAGNAMPLPIESVTKQLVWGAETQKTVTVNTAKSKGIIGAKLSEPLRADGVELQLLQARHDTAVVFATLMDGRNFSSHGHILITALGAEENTGELWQQNYGHPTLGKSTGGAPVRVEGVTARIMLPVAASRVRVYALDERGNRRATLPVKGNGHAVIETDARYQSLWYEVEIR